MKIRGWCAVICLVPRESDARLPPLCASTPTLCSGPEFGRETRTHCPSPTVLQSPGIAEHGALIHRLMSPRLIPLCSVAHPLVKTCPTGGPIGGVLTWTGSDVQLKCIVSPQILSTTSSSVSVGRVYRPPGSVVMFRV